MTDADPFDLQRFVTAQAQLIDSVRAELARGRKATHWMWFVFPQIAGLGFSAMAQRYAIASLDEARAYAAHGLLGARLKECTGLVLAAVPRSAYEIFGSPDDRKFHSSMTLFAHAAPDETLYHRALTEFFAGREDQATLERL
jgi:uncharacterized protein (DUF1810 family)